MTATSVLSGSNVPRELLRSLGCRMGAPSGCVAAPKSHALPRAHSIYKRHGTTTTLFAAFDVLDGVVLGRCMQRHTHQELIRFLNAVERQVPAGKIIHAILDKLRHPQASQGSRLARPAPALGVPLHSHFRLLA